MKEKLIVFVCGVLGAFLLISMIFQAAIHESFKLYPPTAEELEADPSLERYLP